MTAARTMTFALAGLAGLAIAPAPSMAADFGGSCCSDLEERIAELEATTVRKGGRKVALTISGWVDQQITWWDDGEDSNVYVHDLGSTLGTHVKFGGEVYIAPGHSVGYMLHVEALNSDGLTISQDEKTGPGALGANPYVLQSYWFVKSDSLGKISLGRLSQASDNTAILVDGSGSLVSANWVSFDVNSFFVRNAATGQLSSRRWGEAGGCVWGDCNGVPLNAIRYDSPSYGGLSFSASWGEDDFWDYAIRFSREIAGFKFSTAGAVSLSNDVGIQGSLGWNKTIYYQAGLYAEHVSTGIFGLVNYGHFDDGIANAVANSETWFIKAGLRRRFNPLGMTVFYGEYLSNEDGGNAGSELKMWGLGAVQEIDFAAMSVWLKYRDVTVDGLFENGASLEAEDFRWVGAGALINF